MPSSATENYIKVIDALQRRHNQASTKQIAQALDVTMPSVTGMLKRLLAEGLIEHTPYQGVTLTPRGHQIAHDVLRRHRLLELFLHQTLGVPWDEVHQYAEKMEHAIDERLAERIDVFLGHPAIDPHGAPIPRATQPLAPSQGLALDQVAAGTRVRLLEVPDEDPEFLRYLSQLGLTIGAVALVDEAVPYNDSLMLRLGDQLIPLGRKVAAEIRVEPVDLSPGHPATPS